MAKVHYVKASKDYPDNGIAKGQMYYSWQLFKQPVRRSLTRPKPSQLTGSAKLSALYAAQEGLEATLGAATSLDAISEALRACADEVREVADEYNESAENLEQVFTGGSPQIEECREKADAISAYADDLELCADEVEGLEVADYDDEDDMIEDAKSMAGDVSCDV